MAVSYQTKSVSLPSPKVVTALDAAGWWTIVVRDLNTVTTTPAQCTGGGYNLNRRVLLRPSQLGSKDTILAVRTCVLRAMLN
jgi:hypothetical protein